MIQTYKEYLGDIQFETFELDSLTEDMLYDLGNKKGYVIEDDKYDIYLCKKFEPMSFLNQVIIMEKVNEFYVIDMLGVIMFEGNAEDVLEYAKGFLSEDDDIYNK